MVDADIDDVYFFAPDCVIYSTNRAEGASYAIWADRQPVRLPFSIWKVDDRAVWGGYRTNDANQKEWEMLRARNWRWKLNAAPLGVEPEWVRR